MIEKPPKKLYFEKTGQSPQFFDKFNEFSLRVIKEDLTKLHYKLIKKIDGKWERFWLFHRFDDISQKGMWIVSRQISLVEKPELGLITRK